MRPPQLAILIALLTVAPIDGTKIPTNVIELNDRFLDVMNTGLWFVEFYAPWCAHCKKLMPVWELVGHALADKQSPVRMGKLDCTRFSSVASALGIRGYPTVIFFRNGVQIHYEGERRKEDIVKFAEKCAGPVIDKIHSQAQFNELLKTTDREPFFLFFDPANRSAAKGTPEMALRQQFENASDTLFTEVHFYETQDRQQLPENLQRELTKRGEENHTSVIVFKDKSHWITFKSDKGQPMLEWIKRERWPLLPQITASNLHDIAEMTGKKLVLIPLESMDRLNASSESGSFFQIIQKAAEEVREEPELGGHFQFGWLDGDQITNGIVMGTLPMPNLVVFNMSSYEFYLSQDRPDQMTPKSVVLFLRNLYDGFVPVQGGRAWITRLRRMAYDITTNVYDMFQHQPILTVCLFGVPLAFFSIIAYSVCSADFSVDREDVYPEDEEEDLLEEDEDEGGYDMVQPPAETFDAATGDEHEKAD